MMNLASFAKGAAKKPAQRPAEMIKPAIETEVSEAGKHRKVQDTAPQRAAQSSGTGPDTLWFYTLMLQ